MQDYTVTVTVTVGITARSSAQAQERANMLEEHIGIWPGPKRPAWLGDTALETSVEQD